MTGLLLQTIGTKSPQILMNSDYNGHKLIIILLDVTLIKLELVMVSSDPYHVKCLSKCSESHFDFMLPHFTLCHLISVCVLTISLYYIILFRLYFKILK